MPAKIHQNHSSSEPQPYKYYPLTAPSWTTACTLNVMFSRAVVDSFYRTNFGLGLLLKMIVFHYFLSAGCVESAVAESQLWEWAWAIKCTSNICYQPLPSFQDFFSHFKTVSPPGQILGFLKNIFTFKLWCLFFQSLAKFTEDNFKVP